MAEEAVYFETRMSAKTRFLVAALLAVSTAFPQQSRRHITLNVVAFDSRDHIVNDLNREDFQISDQGKTQTITAFSRYGEKQPRLGRGGQAGRQVPPPVVLLFDLLNDNLGNRSYGAQEISRVLEQLEISDSLYLYLLTKEGRLKPIRALPAPGEDAEAENTPWAQHIRPLLQAALDNSYGLRPENMDVAGTTFNALETLAASLRRFPARKNLVWMTHGLPWTDTEQVRRMGTRLDREGLTISSVDQGSDPASGAIDTLEELAETTGGQVFANDFQKAVTEVIAGSRAGYVVEYDAPRPDGKYHKIKVTSSRKGIRLQAEQGYYANP